MSARAAARMKPWGMKVPMRVSRDERELEQARKRLWAISPQLTPMDKLLASECGLGENESAGVVSRRLEDARIKALHARPVGPEGGRVVGLKFGGVRHLEQLLGVAELRDRVVPLEEKVEVGLRDATRVEECTGWELIELEGVFAEYRGKLASLCSGLRHCGDKA